MNEIVHIWAYASLDDRERRRAALARPRWVAFIPKIQALIEEMESKILKPAPFSPLPERSEAAIHHPTDHRYQGASDDYSDRAWRGGDGAVLGAASAQAEEMVFTSWGGTTQDAQKQAWAEPFTQETGIAVLQDGPTDYGKLKAMVEGGNVSWDVVDVEHDFAIKAADDGLLEPLDFQAIDKSTIDPRFVTDHAVGSFYYSFVLAYNQDMLGEEGPKTWADLFDLEKFPDKRTFYKWSAPGAIEIALLADGVAPDQLYPLDLDRAFKKLDTIKDEIVWWSGGAQSQQLLASGEAPLGQFWNGRAFAVQETGVNVGVSWEQNLTAADMLACRRVR